MKDKRKYHGVVNKRSSEQQFRKSSVITFVLPLLCKSGAIQHNRSYGRQAGKAGRLSDKIQVNFEFLKIYLNYLCV